MGVLGIVAKAYVPKCNAFSLKGIGANLSVPSHKCSSFHFRYTHRLFLFYENKGFTLMFLKHSSIL